MAIVRVQVEPSVLEWAIGRSQRAEYLFGKYKHLDDWLSGEVQPTWKQLRQFANDAYTAEGLLYLSEPPAEEVQIPDFRTVGDTDIIEISPNLRDTIYKCLQRQNWYRRFAAVNRFPELEFVGTTRHDVLPESVAQEIRDLLGWNSDLRNNVRDMYDYRKSVVDRAEQAGILVMISGVVGENTFRPLARREFRGFTLHDDIAPVVFVNSADELGAQIFTLAHELAHIWRGQSALSDSDVLPRSANEIEEWCNTVAEEVVAPRAEFESAINHWETPVQHTLNLSTAFKISERVILRRLRSLDMLEETAYQSAYVNSVRSSKSQSSGGNYWYTKPNRVSRNFARAVFSDTFELNTTYTEAFDLLDVSKRSTFDEFARKMGC